MRKLRHRLVKLVRCRIKIQIHIFPEANIPIRQTLSLLYQVPKRPPEDTIMEKLSFKLFLGKERCSVVLADGFSKWQQCQGTPRGSPTSSYSPKSKQKSQRESALDSPED